MSKFTHHQIEQRLMESKSVSLAEVSERLKATKVQMSDTILRVA